MQILLNEKKQAQCPSPDCGKWVDMYYNKDMSQFQIDCKNCRKKHAIFLSQEGYDALDINKKE